MKTKFFVQGEEGDVGEPGPPGEDSVAIGTDTSVIYKGAQGPKGFGGSTGSPGRAGNKGPGGDRVCYQ